MAMRVTRERVEEIVCLDADPIRRNYEITQAYADISRDFRDLVGLQHANWCTFATWASATAGDFIRCDMFPKFLIGKLADNATLSHKLAILMAETTPSRVLRRRGGVRDIASRVASGVAEQIATGNLQVFRELAPAFVGLNELYLGGARPSVSEVRAHFEKRLVPGPSQLDGQTRLLEAFESYAAAAHSQDPAQRAQLTLYGSVMIGFHEQIRLQPAIAGGLDVPFECAVEEMVDLLSTWAVLPSARRAVQANLRRALEGPFKGVVRAACNMYRDAVTQATMTLRLPLRVVDLSSDVVYGVGGLPADVRVERILEATPQLALLMEGLGMLSDGAEDSGARDWTRMTDRMPFILDLFRATQHQPELFDEPLTAEEREAIACGDTPPQQAGLVAA